MKLLTEILVRSLVDHPDEVNVTETEGSMTIILELKVAKEDIGQVIGRQGRTAQALRTILGAVSAKQNKRIMLEIVECPDDFIYLPELEKGRTLIYNKSMGGGFKVL